MNNLIKNVAVWLVIALVLMTVFNQFSARHQQSSTEYSQFIQDVKDGSVAGVTIEGRTLHVRKTDGQRYTVYSPSDPWLVSDLLKAGVSIEAKPEELRLFLEEAREHVPEARRQELLQGNRLCAHE